MHTQFAPFAQLCPVWVNSPAAARADAAAAVQPAQSETVTSEPVTPDRSPVQTRGRFSPAVAHAVAAPTAGAPWAVRLRSAFKAGTSPSVTARSFASMIRVRSGSLSTNTPVGVAPRPSRANAEPGSVPVATRARNLRSPSPARPASSLQTTSAPSGPARSAVTGASVTNARRSHRPSSSHSPVKQSGQSSSPVVMVTVYPEPDSPTVSPVAPVPSCVVGAESVAPPGVVDDDASAWGPPEFVGSSVKQPIAAVSEPMRNGPRTKTSVPWAGRSCRLRSVLPHLGDPVPVGVGHQRIISAARWTRSSRIAGKIRMPVRALGDQTDSGHGRSAGPVAENPRSATQAACPPSPGHVSNSRTSVSA